MVEQSRFTAGQARAIGETIGIDWSTSRFDVEQFRMGPEVEFEHGRRDPATNVTDDDEQTTGKIARAHLKPAMRLLGCLRARVHPEATAGACGGLPRQCSQNSGFWLSVGPL